ncbi:restriction endonuclease subunit S [Oribacterium sp. NK2B42]|uniref:restriction endonuclease subunit S n=1 Tax=Oribacterium sp. NK2B42 TaxID=689781 RepID=UPI000414E382|nr:restriction endonuclease subunit S [Oribacterium sp. NK2B42]
MTPEQLKASILHFAIQGKLVKQRAEEGTAEELYQQIQDEKQKLIKEGKIKKEKPLAEITEDEIPFDIPESWRFCRLGECIDLLSGQDLPSNRYNDKKEGIVYLTGASNIDDNGQIIINRWTTTPTSIATQGNLLLTCKGTIGKTCILNIPEAHIARQIMAITEILVSIEYLRYFIEISISNLQSKAKSMIPGIDRDTVRGLIFPLPPLEEQHRIVAKIEELLPYVDRYAEAYNKFEKFNAKFPEDMKKSILQYAIQGKLVEQRPEEGTAEELYQQIQDEKQRLIKEGKIKKEKPLAEITVDEIPFDIPESWKWVRVCSVGVTQTGNTPKKSHPEYFGNYIPFLGPGDIQNGNVNYDNQGLSEEGKEYGRVTPSDSVLQVCIGGSIGKCALVDREVTFNQQINSIYPLISDSKYVYYVLDSYYFKDYMKENSGGTATPIINRGLWDAIVIPLPPLEEQHRIVAKIEELLPFCERLVK